MATYLIGDVHGCYDELIALLHKVEFTPGKDTLWLTGDLVARGPGSLDVLRYVKSLGDSVRLVLGNHDLHLLAVFAGISRNKPKDRLTPLLEAPDADELLNWAAAPASAANRRREKAGDGPRRDHAAVGSADRQRVRTRCRSGAIE